MRTSHTSLRTQGGVPISLNRPVAVVDMSNPVHMLPAPPPPMLPVKKTSISMPIAALCACGVSISMISLHIPLGFEIAQLVAVALLALDNLNSVKRK